MRRHYIVHGRVQGVGFRAFVERRAQGLGLTGWVRNRADGTVEAEAQGEPSAITEFEVALRRGPALSRVLELDRDAREPVVDEADFRTRY